MSEEVKKIRLNKVAKELNVSVNRLVEFLAKKGHHVESNPNTKISPEEYELLAKAFKSEREVRENAEKIEISTTVKNIHKTDAKEVSTENAIDTEKDVMIKNDAESTTDTDTTVSVKEKLEEKLELVEQKEPDFEPQVIQAKVSNDNNGEDVYTAEIRIVDKINLDDINVKIKSRSDKKKDKEQIRLDKKAQKEAERQKALKHKKEEKKAEKNEKQTKLKPQNISAKDDKETLSVKEVIQQPNVSTDNEHKDTKSIHDKPVVSEKVTEFIETQYQKLEGPKVVSKIDLSQFDKPKSKNNDTKLKNNEVTPQSGEDKKKKKRKRLEKKSLNDTAVPQQPKNKQVDKKDKNKAKDKPKKEKVKKKQEIDDAEIEKQIRETLARLSPLGKSKTSKHRREKRQTVQQHIEEEQIREAENKKVLKVTEFVTANELATMMDIPVNKIIATCMAVGMFVSINQRLDAETIKLIVDEFGYQVDFVSADLVDAIHEIEEEDNPEDLVLRNPVVTVMGHVDHGKTSLLDYIRNANVIAGEAGGITQHIGAYEVTTNDGRKITFLDTPGHEAFTAMRARGAKITDIAIIVVAADDRVMPQTVEAINHAQAANVPIVFAINKIDKPAANPDKIKEELANMNLLVEEWGGKYQSQDISAKKGLNVDLLLEKVLLEAEILELKGNPNKRAKGTILESSLDKGRGYVAKILVQDGTIRTGDPVLAGSTYGRVKAMYNERNQIVKEAGPSTPVLLLGLNGAPQAGDTFNVMENEKEAKDLAAKRFQLQREQGIRTQKHITLDEIGRRIAIGDFKQLNLIVKGDVDGSVEALSDSLLKLSTDEVQVNVVHKAVGQITESDVLLATASNAIIIGFQVRPSVQARKLAESEQIDIRLYSIIYTAINELKDAIEGMLSPEIQEKINANLEIREIFKISKVGTIAGCMCLDGKILRTSKMRVIRDGIVVYTGKLASLKRFKDDVKEVLSGQDCGLSVENFNDIKVGDIIEAYEEIEVKRKL
ncbi:MAG: translation initiation factor IF-2 [Bacteroidales bacterium]|nr:translation initiation factor IF-2 [Bacteroidales bacterium]